MSAQRREWTEYELLAVLSLYRQLPFGKMDSRTPAVINLAREIGRTPGAVALKLVNFASFDPTLRARGVRGMGNASRLDRQVWARSATEWGTLASALPASVNDALDAEQQSPVVTEVGRTQVVRRGQSFFRHAVLSAYEIRCCLTGISDPSLLRASHIIPWATSESERLNPANGICLNTLHDAAFDRGLMTFSESFEVVLSPVLKSSMPVQTYERYFASVAAKQMQLPRRTQPDRAFLAFHRANIFLDKGRAGRQ